MTQDEENQLFSLAASAKQNVHGLALDMANALANQVALAGDESKAGTGYLGEATCKVFPQFATTQPRHP